MFKILQRFIQINQNIHQQQKSVTKFLSNFTVAMSEAVESKLIEKDEKIESASSGNGDSKSGKSKDSYKSRYNGKFKRKHWVDFTPRTDEDSQNSKRANLDPVDRIKRKKCLILMGYSGSNYYGMQRNPDMLTIEEVLLTAMLKTKWISDDAFATAQTIQFQRAARTDKGVSAARQCVSLKLRRFYSILIKKTSILTSNILTFSFKQLITSMSSN